MNARKLRIRYGSAIKYIVDYALQYISMISKIYQNKFENNLRLNIQKKLM